MSERLPNRWLVAVAGVIIQLCLGTIYGWSVFAKPLMAEYGWTQTQVTLPFTIAIGVLGIATVTGGIWLDRKGPRIVATVGTIMFSIGTILAGFAIQNGSLPLLYLTYGVIAGLGLGLGYITPIATLVKWFPDKRGLITGIAVMGFGLGALMMTFIAPLMIVSLGISGTFYIFGIIFLVVLAIASQFLVEPSKGWLPAGWTPPKTGVAVVGMSLREAVKTKFFWLLWGILFVNITAGIALISQASPMAQEIVGLTAAQAGILLGIMSVFNGVGRLLWASVSDYIGRRNVFLILFATQGVVFLILPSLTSLIPFAVITCYILFCYGGGLATMPAFTADIFGTKSVGTIYGWLLTSWSAAGVVGPMFFAYIRETYQGYNEALYLTGIALIIALILPLMTKQNNKLLTK